MGAQQKNSMAREAFDVPRPVVVAEVQRRAELFAPPAPDHLGDGHTCNRAPPPRRSNNPLCASLRRGSQQRHRCVHQRSQMEQSAAGGSARAAARQTRRDRGVRVDGVEDADSGLGGSIDADPQAPDLRAALPFVIH